MVRIGKARPLLIAAILGVRAFSSEGKPAGKSSGPATSGKAQASSFERCDTCSSQVRRRIAVLPVHVGPLPEDGGLSSRELALTVREKVEALVSAQPGLYSLPHSDFIGMSSKATSTSSSTSGSGLASYRQLPVQAILVVTLDAIELKTDDKNEVPGSVAVLLQKAQEADKEAAEMDERAEAALNSADDGSSAYLGGEIAGATCAIILAGPCSTPQCFSDKNARYQSCVEQANERAEQARDRARQEGQYRAQRAESENRSRAQSLRAQAQQYRKQAQVEGQQGLLTKRTTSGHVTIQWSSVDASSGVTLASGSATGTSSDLLAMKASELDGVPVSSAVCTKVVTEAVDHALRDVMAEYVASLSQVPFRVKVVSTEGRQIVINGGSTIGVGIGDTFGVRPNAKVMTDPDSGKPIEPEPAPVGRFRVMEVRPKVAVVQALEPRSVKRGDELVWIGVFTEAGKNGGQQ